METEISNLRRREKWGERKSGVDDISKEEVSKTPKKRKSGKSAGFDKSCVKFLK